MRHTKPLRLAVAITMALFVARAAVAAPIIGTLVENNRDLTRPAAVVSSALYPSPSGTSADLQDEAFVHANRTHEYTAVRTNPSTGVLSTDATHELQPFPSYLVGLEYIQVSNENRSVANYSLDVTLTEPAIAYLFLDNRLNGPLSNVSSLSTTDPVLGGPLQWVIDDGWERVNTGFMPGGQADYLGIDEGVTVASEDLRNHTSTGLVGGSGNGLNNFFAIYTKQFAAGTHIGFTKQLGIGGGNMYGVAVAPVPEPSTLAILFAAALAGLGAFRLRGKR